MSPLQGRPSPGSSSPAIRLVEPEKRASPAHTWGWGVVPGPLLRAASVPQVDGSEPGAQGRAPHAAPRLAPAPSFPALK